MTISSAFQSALSGLRAASQATDVIASNISNAGTAGYARRILEVSAASQTRSGGVEVNGVVRITDPGLTGARRSAEADLSYSRAVHTFTDRLETALGTPDNPRALTNAINDFDKALLTARSDPGATERLSAAVESARSITEAFSTANTAIADMRSAADDAINAQVTRLNSALQDLKNLNTKIAQVNISGQDDSGLQDIRQTLVDEINQIIPVNEATRDHGKIALYSKGGLILLDGNAVTFDFTPANRVTPYQTLAGGQLSGLTANGIAVRTGSANSNVPGGTLAANFAVRDELGTDAQSQIDAAARNLVERFQDPTVDPTLGPTDMGLFTDGGTFFDPANELGLAGRMTLNSAVDPRQNGETWRLRDGLAAAAPGPAGTKTLLDSLRDTLAEPGLPASGDFGTGALSLSDVANSLMGRLGVQRLAAEQSVTFAATSYHETSQAERAFGVDTDSELQNLILVEQHYAANARMLQTINEMMDTLMRIAE